MRIELAAMFAKELRQTVRDRKTLAMLVVAPLLQMLLLGFAVDLNVENTPTVIADEDHTVASREFTSGLLAGDAFTDYGLVRDATEATVAIERGDASLAIVVPRGFARDLAEARPTSIQVFVDGADSMQGVVAQNAVATYVATLSVARARERLSEATAQLGYAPAIGTVRVEPRTFYNPTLNSQHFFVPGIAATLLLVVTIIITALGLGREQEAGTLEQVLVTPISPRVFVAGKTLPYAVIGLFDLALVIVGGAVVFGVPMRGELWLIFLAGFFYLLTTLGIGVFAGTIAKSQQQAFMNVVFVLLPAVILSGFMSPIQAMPEWLQPITALNPVRHFVEIMRAVLLKGADITDIAHSLIALIAMGLVIFPVAAMALQRKLR